MTNEDGSAAPSNRRESGLEWFVAHQKWCEKMCFKTCGRRAELVEEALSVCVDYAEQVRATYDAAKGPLDRHMRVNLRWYVFKWARYYRPKQQRELVADVFPDHLATLRRDHEDLADRDQVEKILEGVSDADVVRMRAMDELTFSEIGEILGVSKNTVRKRYYAALEEIRGKTQDRTGRGDGGSAGAS